MVEVRLGPGPGAAFLQRQGVREAFAELLRRAGRTEEARDSFRRALDLTEQEPERRFLTRKLKELQ